MNYSELYETLDRCTQQDLKECIIDLYSLSYGALSEKLTIGNLTETMRYRIENLPLPSSLSLSKGGRL